MKYEESVKHKLIQTEHIRSILTSKEFACESKFMAVAQALGKLQIIDSKEFYINPYKMSEKRGRPSKKTLDLREEYKNELIR